MKFKDGTEEEFYKAWNNGQVKRVYDGKRMVPEREWVGLTEDDLVDTLWPVTLIDVVRLVEAKLKEKNYG